MFVFVAQVAQFVGVSPSYLKKLHLQGKGGEPYTTSTGRRYYTAAQIDELRALLDRTFPKHRIEYRRSNPQSHSLPGKVFFATRAVAEPAFSYVCDQHIVCTEK